MAILGEPSAWESHIAEESGRTVRVGLISDTHGVLDHRVFDALAGVDAIVHAGDVYGPDVMWKLEKIAPVVAAAEGNCDREHADFLGLVPVAQTTVAGKLILVIHDFHDLGPVPEEVDVVVCGHTHRPRNEWHGRTLVVNPGSASQKRAMPSRSVGLLEIAADGRCEAIIVMLDDLGAQA